MFFKNNEQKEIENTMQMSINPEIIRMNDMMQQNYIQQNGYYSGSQQNTGYTGGVYGSFPQNNVQYVSQQARMIEPMDIPRFITKEFKLIKFFNTIWLLGALSGLAFFGYDIYKNYTGEANFAHYIVPAIVVLISFYKLVDALLNIKGASRDIKKLSGDLSKGFQTVPNFLVKVVENINLRRVDVNWFAISTYVILGGFLFATNQLQGWTVPIFNHRLDFSNLEAHKFYATIFLITTLVLHIIFQIWTRVRLERITSFYGYDIVPKEQIIELRRSRNKFYRRLLLIVAFILLFGFIIIGKILQRVI